MLKMLQFLSILSVAVEMFIVQRKKVKARRKYIFL